MKKSAWLALPAVLGLFILAVPQVAAPQMMVPHSFVPQIFALQITERRYPAPPPSLDPQAPDKEGPSPSRRIDLVQLQRDADDLSRTAQTIPGDVANVRKGMLPKDVIEKLKQIEKLSKRLRTELNP
jgi:hypothetical protein